MPRASIRIDKAGRIALSEADVQRLTAAAQGEQDLAGIGRRRGTDGDRALESMHQFVGDLVYCEKGGTRGVYEPEAGDVGRTFGTFAVEHRAIRRQLAIDGQLFRNVLARLIRLTLGTR